MTISIHAPIVGCDSKLKTDYKSLKISIHAPIVGCDASERFRQRFCSRFQSTHPSWGATKIAFHFLLVHLDFNPRTHRGVRPYHLVAVLVLSHISIHAPIVGCDNIAIAITDIAINFNPRTHRGVRRIKRFINSWLSRISIHAPIVGCDFTFFSSGKHVD